MKTPRIVVAGIGPVGGFGQGIHDWERMFQAEPKPNASINVKTPEGARTYPAHLADVSTLGEFIPVREFRRTDKLTRMAALGSCLALRDACFEGMDRSRIGLVLVTGFGSSNTTFGFLESRIRYGDTGVSPILFSNSGNSGPASNVSILLGITGPALTICQFEIPVIPGLSTACQWLREDRVDVVLFGGMDEYSPVLGYCRDRFLGKANAGPMHPFELDLQSSVVGEGCCVLALARELDTPTKAMAAIENVTMEVSGPLVAGNEVHILAADGFSGYGTGYRFLVESATPAASYVPHYGSFPSVMAFDIAVAATAFQRGRLPVPPAAGMNPSMRVRMRDAPSVENNESIICFSCNAYGYQGRVRVQGVSSFRG